MAKDRLPVDTGKYVRFVKDHPCQNSIQHKQLRDLIRFDDRSKQIFTVYQSRILRCCPASGEVQELQGVRYHSSPPSTFDVRAGYLATGTDKGELTVYTVEEREGAAPAAHVKFSEGITGNADVLNNLSLVTSHGMARLYACSNDNCVRCFSLPQMNLTDTIKHDVAINYCAESPSGQMLVTLGDNDRVQLHHRDSTGRFKLHHQYVVDHRAGSVPACGMCCSWHPWGSCFATAFECGRVVFWDARMSKPVAKQRVNGIARTVKFSSQPIDLVAIAQHEQYFHVVDARMLSARQQLQAANYHVPISGMAFSPEAGRLFIGREQHSIQEWQVDTLSRRGISTVLFA